MRAVLVDVPESMLAERHRLGHDKFDEMWEGELHMVPPACFEHNRLYNLLLRALLPAVDAAGLTILGDGSGLYDPDVPGHTSYRVPDLVVFEPVVASERGIEGRAHLVVEVRSTGDESYDKLTFYSRVGVLEVLVVERDTKEVRRWAVPAGSEDGGGVDLRLVEQQPDGDGWHRLAPSRSASAAGRACWSSTTGRPQRPSDSGPRWRRSGAAAGRGLAPVGG